MLAGQDPAPHRQQRPAAVPGSVCRQVSREFSLDQAGRWGRPQDELETAVPSPYQTAEESEQREKLAGFLLTLSARQREAVILHIGEELSFAETGSRLHCSADCVRKLYERAPGACREDEGLSRGLRHQRGSRACTGDRRGNKQAPWALSSTEQPGAAWLYSRPPGAGRTAALRSPWYPSGSARGRTVIRRTKVPGGTRTAPGSSHVLRPGARGRHPADGPRSHEYARADRGGWYKYTS